MGFYCSCCGCEHEGVLRDLAYAAPEAYLEVPASERAARTKLDSEHCAVSEGGKRRFFIRGLLHLPVVGDPEDARFGIWAEISPSVFGRYLELASAKAPDALSADGSLANEVSGYPASLGLALRVDWESTSLRPTFRLAADDHLLVHDQRRGMSMARFHEVFVNHGKSAPAAPSAPPRLLTCADEHTTRAWPFATPPTLAAHVTQQAMRGAPILRAFHERDGSWTFLHADDTRQADLVERCHQHVVDLDRSLRLLADLPRGSAATREGRLYPWAYRQISGGTR